MAPRDHATEAQAASQISFEVRNSLNAVVGFSEMLEQGVYGPLSHDQMLGISAIRQAGENLLGMVDDILKLFEESRRLTRSAAVEVDIPLLIAQQTRRISSAITDPGIDIRSQFSETLGLVRLDASSFQAALGALLTNAVRRTLAPGLIEILVDEGPDQDLILTIRDNGVGMGAEEAAQWSEGMSGNREIGPESLDALSVKSFLDRHDGSVEMDDRLGLGTTITVRFRADAAPRP